ncbi:MAG: PGPGW domain-containing protein [Desulfobacterales bacterium]|nr:PGPGW domain-containing protein [Desulfobacterales bacterium]
MTQIFQFFQQHPELLAWLGGLSVLTFFGTIVGVPVFLVALPRDYLAGTAPPRSTTWPLPVRLAYRIGKNVLGGLMFVAGLAMLVLPGQGLLTIFAGLVLSDIPGKRRIIRGILGRKPVFEHVNRLRIKAHKPPLDPP